MWRRMSSETVRLRGGVLAPRRENANGAPNRTHIFTGPVNIELMWMSSVPRIATGTTGAPECSASIPAAPHCVRRSLEIVPCGNSPTTPSSSNSFSA
jgi:hypothetical protein